MHTKGRDGLTTNKLASLERFSRLAVTMLEKRLLPAPVAGADLRMRAANERYRLATHVTNHGIWDWHCSKNVSTMGSFTVAEFPYSGIPKLVNSWLPDNELPSFQLSFSQKSGHCIEVSLVNSRCSPDNKAASRSR